VINNTNEIYASTSRNNDQLIEREKDLLDKRSDAYFIDNKKAEILRKYFL
jgi:hypothetical protein